MADESKVRIEKFNGTDFGWWKMQIEDLLVQMDLDVVLGEKPEKLKQEEWEILDKKAKAVIRLTLTKDVAYNILKETTAREIMNALADMYEKPSGPNKVYLIKELFNTKMKAGTAVTSHINNLNSILSRLESVGIKFEDEVQALILLSSLPESWSGTVTAVSNSVGSEGFKFNKMRDLVLGEDIRRRNSGESSGSSDLLNVNRGRRGSRGSGGRRRSQSRPRGDVTCWNCKEKGHFRNQCPGDRKEANAAEDYSEDDALICSVESSVDFWVMDSGASFHATHCSETMRNLKVGDFGRVRLANDETLEVTGMGDIDLLTSAGTIWTLTDVRVIPGLKRSLISVGQLGDQGYSVRFSDGQWRATKGNLVIARGYKRGSLFVVSTPSEDRARSVLKKKEVRFIESRGQKTVHFAREGPRARVQIQNERVRVVKPVSGYGNSGSSGSSGSKPGSISASVTASNRQWVRNTKIPTNKVSPDAFLLSMESVGSQDSSRSGSLIQWEPVGSENEPGAVLAVADGLKLHGASTGSQVT